MILIGIGANLNSERFGAPVEGCAESLKLLNGNTARVARCSGWYRSAPQPVSDQPDYVNGIAQIETALDPAELLARLHEIERAMGRTRSVRNAARVIDLDLIDYDGLVSSGPDRPFLPHPRMHDRAFVLLPLRDVAPDWRHPVTGSTIDALIRDLPGGQACVPFDPGP